MTQQLTHSVVMDTWDAVAAFALALPDTILATAYGKPAVKLNGRTIAATTGPDNSSFVAHVAPDDKAVLLATDPDTFWETDHYRGWPAVLVRYASADPDRIRLALTRAWWDRARRAQRAAFGERP